MDPLRIHAYKTRAAKKHKGQQLLNDFILYSLTALACTSFCSSPLWYPPFCATFNVFFFFSLPKITSFFFTSKALFIVGNLIVIFLLGESKFFASKSKDCNDVSHDKYECTHRRLRKVTTPSHEPKVKKVIDTPINDIQVKNLELETCEANDQEEFFELCNDEETCELDVENTAASSCQDEDKLSCSRREIKVVDEEQRDGDVHLPTEKLNKLVDDFIARIIRQRRLEDDFCRG
ncbi:hypothetical protein Tco_0489600 [Tanacetum coccineum]